MVHVPEIPPIMNSMTIAVVTSPMLLRIASSKSSHGFLKSHIASHTHRPDAKRRETWLAPNIASLPKKLMFNASSIISTAIGINDMTVRIIDARFIFTSFTSSSTCQVVVRAVA